MKTIKKVTIEPIFVKTIPEDLEENKLYISEIHSVAIHNCLCGCRERTVTPINYMINGKDHGWKLIKHDNDKVSLTPSISNYQTDCKSHYILTKNVANFV